MSGSNYVGHFNAAQKTLLGWMTGRTANLTAGGNITLAPLETGGTSIKAAVVDATAARSYWLEYRRPIDYDNGLPSSGTNGVLVHVRDNGISGDSGTSLIDVRPGGGVSTETATMLPGTGWTTPEGYRLAVGRVTASGASITVTKAGTTRRGPRRPA